MTHLALGSERAQSLAAKAVALSGGTEHLQLARNGGCVTGRLPRRRGMNSHVMLTEGGGATTFLFS